MAIELKNPNGSNKTSPEQDAYLERLRGCNVATLVSNNYEEVIIFLHEHYKDVKQTRKMLVAIEDHQQAARINPRQSNAIPNKSYVEASSSRVVVDFSHNDYPAYWCKQLQNKENLLKECRCRGLDPEELWRLPNKQIASVLISHDKTTVVIHK